MLDLLATHKQLVRSGKYNIATRLLKLLRTGKVTLYLGRADIEADNFFYKCDLPCKIDRYGNWITYTRPTKELTQ